MTYQEQQDAIKNKAAGVVNDARDHFANVADKVRSEATAARRDLSDAASDIAHRASDALGSVDADSVSAALKSSIHVIAENTRKAVRERPLGALAVAAAIGLLLGAMSSR